MTPPVEAWHASELPLRVQITAKGTRRKGMKQANLKECELLELLQYKCEVEEPQNAESLTICWPVERLFRRCQDRNGKFMVETTAWEGRSASGKVG